ncbi:MAG: hypothetical protein J7518_05820 [Nocardioidaceae bacterium]|nr:hypothetical protein [Nocardioidaceae bacterium]
MASLLVGAFGAARAADPTPSPTPSPAPSGTPATTSSQTPSPEPSPTSSPTATPSGQARLGLGPETVAADDYGQLARGKAVSVDVLRNDTCENKTPCPRATLAAFVLTSVPAGWTATITPGTGVVTVRVPASATPGVRYVGYGIRDSKGTGANARLAVRVVIPPKDSYNPVQGTYFSHPFRKAYKYRIRDVILRTINSVPYGGQIRIASWSFSSYAYRTALFAAKQRGVSVQIVLSNRNTPAVSDWNALRRMFGTTNVISRDKGSWVYKCVYSCRGVSGTMHSKIFMFSRSATTPWVVMTGSANLTDFAVTSQWNQMSVVTRNQAVWNDTLNVFYQLRADRPASPQYVEKTYPDRKLLFYPRGAPVPENDFLVTQLRGVKCTGAATANGRTQIRIAMYAWYQNRGRWLANRVRTLWNQGCDIRIVYGIMGNGIKNQLYSPTGRGRIPMRQILLTNKEEEPIYYIHDKWVAIYGNVWGKANATTVLQGSFNFSDLGFRSDENFEQRWGLGLYRGYIRDFGILWTEPQARAPSPTSVITNVDRSTGSPTLGRGAYTYMSTD